ncbi:MAG: PAS domain-containing protein [Rhodospirillales bacterium]
MDIRKTFSLIGLILLTVFLLAVVWEFAVEELIEEFLAIPHKTSYFRHRWEEVILVVFFAGTSLIVLTLLVRQRVQAHEALKESEERFKGLSEVTADWFWEQDSDLRFIYHSPRYFEITGFRPEHKLGTRRKHYVDAVDLEQDAGKWAAHEEDLEARRPFKNFEYAFKTFDGRIIHVRISGVPLFDAKGNFLGYRGSGTDITEIKKAEEETRKLVDAIANLQEGIAFFSPDEKLIFCNREYRRLRPAIKHLLVPGASFERLLKADVESGEIPEAQGREEEYIRERLDSFRDPKEPFTRQLANGNYFLIKEGKTLDGGTYSTSMDITALKQAEETLREERRKFAGGSQ